MQGEAIADGPIPFIFGAKVDKMKQRYWIRDITPKEEIGKRTWLEASRNISTMRPISVRPSWC